ncbi:MAG: energy transducer TonB [Luteimonas sp.]
MQRWRPSTRAMRLSLAAFAIGLLLFLALWWRDRGNDFYRADSTPAAVEGQQFEPLPAPLPAGESPGTASGMEEPTHTAQQPAPHIVQPPPTAAPAPAPRPPPAPVGDVATGGSAPQPIESPAPSYPREALRNGDSGAVLLRVHVGPDGIPYAVDLVRSSRSRSLDRAAADAVRRWRFRPAQRDGQPVPGEVLVPIAFNADR